MSNLPAKIERIWIVDAAGAAKEQHVHKPLSSGQRHQHYRLGLIATSDFLKSRGFNPNAADSGSSVSYEKRVNGAYVWIDISLKKPDNVAFVTSAPGYLLASADGADHTSARPRAKVTNLRGLMGCDLFIQAVVSTSLGGTSNPVYIPLPKDVAQPARYVIENIAGVLAAAGREIPLVGESFNRETVKEAEEWPIDYAGLAALADATRPD